MIAVLFALIFRVLPDAKVAWRDVLLGGAVTALLFAIGKFAIGLYLGQKDPGQAFGAAGALAVLLVWIYYSAQILFLGAEFTHVWACRRGSMCGKEGAMADKPLIPTPPAGPAPTKEPEDRHPWKPLPT